MRHVTNKVCVRFLFLSLSKRAGQEDYAYWKDGFKMESWNLANQDQT